jgi:endoglucanase
MRVRVGLFLVLMGSAILIFIIYQNSKFSTLTRSFSPYTLLNSSWTVYVQKFINDDGRVVDDREADLTTSEGQSYAMLRAVWVDDKQTFDKVWTWTKQNLQKRDDKLFGWRWGKKEDGGYGFLSNGGENSASDADSDIALALILASRRWKKGEYLEEAKLILPDIWKILVREDRGKNYLTAGNWADSPEGLVLNPSYFAPYAWRIFAETDKDRDWNSLINPAYELLGKLGSDPLDKSRAVGLPPDWVLINRDSGTYSAPLQTQLTTNYSFDALRVPWRIGLDYAWNEEPQAKLYLDQNFKFLADEFEAKGFLGGWYSHDGQVLGGKENPAMYAAAMGYFKTIKPDLAQKIYEEKLLRLYANDQNSFRDDIPYYEQNWLWFGAALYEGFLHNYK